MKKSNTLLNSSGTGLAVAAGLAILTLGCDATLGGLENGEEGAVTAPGAQNPGDGDGAGAQPSDDPGDCEDCSSAHRDDVRQTCETSRAGSPLLRRLTRSELENSLRDIFPELSAWQGVELSRDPTSALGFSTDAMVLVVNGPTFRNLLDTAEDVAGLVTSSPSFETLLPCSATSPGRACAEEFVQHYGLRLFRRPLTVDENARYLSYFDSVHQASDFRSGIKWTLSVMLQSPHHFYRSEVGTAEGDSRKLDQYEVATNLAYTYSGTTPSAELLAKAERGELSGAALEETARQLLLDPRHAETKRLFFREWLGHEQVLNQSREQSPDFASSIAPRLVQETERFLDHIVETDGTIFDLLLADYTFLDQTLSNFYGYGGVVGDEFSLVTRPAGHGLGLLAQGSLLAATSHQTETSPTLRGLLFTERFLCIEPPAPPATIPPLEAAPGIENAQTTREKYEDLHAVSGCSNCHDVFDPYGFAFEQFDETGRFRETEHGAPIDTVATVRFINGDQTDVSNIESLARLVETRDDVEQCVSGLISAYMLSGAGGEICVAEDSREKFVKGEISILDFMVSLAASPHFSERRM